jgi:penicillin V acylase-like amidase (Ntn superfamily)
MNRKFTIFMSVVIMTALSSPALYPCTTFVLHQGNRLIFGRNLDWISGTGLLILNPRNMEKKALVDSSKKAITWVSKFGSMTFNQIGRELPFGGINESGLVVEHMTLDGTTYPAKDHRYPIGAFQWIQYQLDNFSTVEEVIASDTLLRIDDANSKIHFLLCDRFGHSAVIEFLNGTMVCHTGTNLPMPALANSTYDESMNCLINHGDVHSNLSLAHFVTVATQAQHVISSPDDSLIGYAFQTLRMVNQGLPTKWSIVYDITNMRIYFKIYETPTIVGEQKIFTKMPPYDPGTKIVDLHGLDFNCSTSAKVLDLNCGHEDLINPYFEDYSTKVNKEFISKAFTFYRGWGIPINVNDAELEYLAKYPESFKCVEKRR